MQVDGFNGVFSGTLADFGQYTSTTIVLFLDLTNRMISDFLYTVFYKSWTLPRFHHADKRPPFFSAN
jgi:hypothetical protein